MDTTKRMWPLQLCALIAICFTFTTVSAASGDGCCPYGFSPDGTDVPVWNLLNCTKIPDNCEKKGFLFHYKSGGGTCGTGDEDWFSPHSLMNDLCNNGLTAIVKRTMSGDCNCKCTCDMEDK
ncbi:CC-chemokine family protein [Fowlpox virus]|uniref:CC chemokine family protein n=1 Tax=Fowlpox virus TaxID=10261 RepID=A0A385HAJ0_FOWPV|nr:CC chemokine family protein [Fowlpox virus]AXY04563.1 CC-chemokine family protein [Fowlpox virus]AXY04825.1 CC-chemokine family protein [Fowlpox virus]AXY05084.1 CC-chemokine family protein [Fowlpox virus]URH24840.1 CC chemokine gene family protein [Fowlpox virus]